MAWGLGLPPLAQPQAGAEQALSRSPRSQGLLAPTPLKGTTHEITLRNRPQWSWFNVHPLALTSLAFVAEDPGPLAVCRSAS
jgi:hypothetical protein